jgi:acyl-coenzyme A thioesterase PaaI-like protein
MSSSKQSFLGNIALSPAKLRHLMNVWPPFIGMKIHVEKISPDWRHVRIRMKLGLLNRNFVGTHFGGALFSMVDPFCMIPMMQLLGKDYLVWDKAGRIEFVAPGRGTVYADIRVSDEQLSEARARTADGGKFEPTYPIDIVDAKGELIARVEKTLYIRKRREQTPSSRIAK